MSEKRRQATNRLILPLLRKWLDTSDSGDRDAAVELERAVIRAISPPDDGTGEARAEIAKAFVSALASDDEEGARRVLGDSREILKNALQELDRCRDDDARVPVPVPEITGDYPGPVLSLAGRPGAVLSEGSVAIVSGAGGTAKSALVLHQALAFAMAAPDRGADCGGWAPHSCSGLRGTSPRHRSQMPVRPTMPSRSGTTPPDSLARPCFRWSTRKPGSSASALCRRTSGRAGSGTRAGRR